MSRFTITTGLAMLAIMAGTEMTPARAQQVLIAPQPYIYATPTTTYSYPARGYTTVRPYRSRGVLPGFSRRGGIGTTPFLGNTRGLGAYSTNYSAPTRTYYYYPTPTPTYVAPAPIYSIPPVIGG